MPGQHNTQKYKLVGCYVDYEFLGQIDQARGEKSRSLFVREAIAEKCGTQGIIVLRDKVATPDRAGKGGPKPISYFKSRHKKLKEPI